MDIRRFFGVQTSKTVAAGSSKKSEADEKSRGSSEKFHGKVRKSEKGNDNRKKKTSKTSESDDDKPLRRRKTKDKKKNIKAFDSDSSEEEPLPAKLRKRSKKSAKDKKGRATTVISSDEEDTLLARLNKSTKNGETSKSVSQETSVPKKSPVKIIEDISEYFGTKPVERTFKRAHSMKRKERSEDVNCLADEKQTNNLNNNGHETETVGRTSARQDEIAPEQPFKKVKRSSYDAGRTCSSSQDKDKHQVERSSQEIRTKSTSEHEKHSPSSESTASHKSASTVKSTSPTKVISPSESTTPSKSTPTTYTTPVSKPTSKAKAASETKSTPTTQSTPLKSREKTSDAADVVPSSLERKSSGYRNYMMREGPQALGSKEIPKGSENCLAGLVFVVTGVLESIEREDALDLIKRYGGKVTQAVSKKTSYLVVGREAGNSKLDKAKQLGTRQIDEDGLFDIIRASSKKSAKATETPEMNKQKDSPEKPLTPSTSRTESQTSDNFSPSQRPSQSSLLSSACSTPATQTPSASPLATDVERESLLWVDKYSPKSIKQIIGQQGDRSNVKKLLRWLQNWHANQKAGKSKGGYFAGKEDGSIFKAALLSGPPGVGKTTSAHLVCKESGFSFVEFNASDSRNRKTLEELVAELLNNRTMDSFLLSSEPRPSSERHALIMDEVDGMAGNEDRGGMQELIALIKSSKIPIICMCNDRNSQKVRSLANYCFDLRFQKPRVEQIKGAMLSIAFKEGLKVSPQAMEKVIVGANQDIRQVLHHLSMWTSRQKSLNYDEAKADSDKAHKDIKLGPFDVTRKIFSAEESSKMNMQEYFSLFFNDYSLIPLFSQENYLQVVPFRAGGNSRKILNCLSEAAESFCDADLVDKLIRSNGSWNLLPLQSFFSCVLPGKMMQGRVGQRIEFPSWLGKHSTTGKNSRILQDLVCHTQLSVSGSKRELNLDYIPFLRKALSSPLIHANTENCSSKVSEVMEVMDSYHLLKEDWETVLEVGQFENKPKLMAGIDSKVKAAFTRAYNKEAHMAPYSSSQAAAKKKSGRAPSTLETEGMEVGQEEEETGSDDDLEHDAMIKVKKPSKAGRRGKGKTNKSNSGPKESKGARGKGVGKGKGKKP